MKIQFCGAAKEVTGSSHLITLDDGYTILLDCGLYQGHKDDMEDFNHKWRFDPSAIDCLVLSHAHIDHTGRVPQLYKDGFGGLIYSTHATRSLCALMLLDSAKIQEYDAAQTNKRAKKRGKPGPLKVPLYSMEDARQVLNHFVSAGYEDWIRIHENVEILFLDAGHILGSASVTLRVKRADGTTTTLGFTGDIGRPNRPILRDPQPMPPCDYILTESTYGDRLHEEAPQELNRFLEIILSTCVENKGKLIIPAFSVGRSQEIVYMLDQLANHGKLPKIPVYVDSPLAVNATTIFGTHPECYDNDLHEYLLTDDDPFGFNGLQYLKTAESSKALNSSKEPCIIISASGMMTAGRIKHHLYNNIENPKNTFLMVGYCAPGTPGAYLRDGSPMVRIFGEEKIVNARIEVMDSFSAHGDYEEMMAFLENQRTSAKKVFLVHGDEETMIKYKDRLQTFGFKDVRIPDLGETFQLG